MIESTMANPRQRQLLVSAFLVVSSGAAGWSIYHGKLKILALLGLLTAGVFLRLAGFANAYLLTLLCATLSMIHIDVIHEEFDKDKWLALFAMAALSLAAAAFSIRNPPWPRLVHLAVLGLVGVSLWSFSWSVDSVLSFQKAGVFTLVMLIAFVGIWSWARTTEEVRRIAEVHVDNLWVVWPVGVATLIAFGGAGFIAGRFRSIFINPNNLGYWGSLTIPLLFAFTLTHPVKWRRWTCAGLLGCAAICVLLSGSRGGIIGASMGCGIYCLLRFTKPTVAAGVLGSIVLVFLVAYGVEFAIPDSLQQIIRPDTIGDLSDRRMWWVIAMLIWRQRPWLGHGFGLTDRLFGHYGLDTGEPGAFGATVHNSYLEVAMNLGLIGLGLTVLVIGWSVLAGLRTWFLDKRGPNGLLSLALTCVLIAGAAHAAIESILYAAGNPWSLPFWVTAALIHRLASLASAARAAPAGEEAGEALAPEPAPAAA